MFDFFQGTLVRKTPGSAVIDVGGVGYALRISLPTYDALPSKGSVRIFAHLESGGDAGIRLFGFATEPERDIFRLLLNVSGVGPATALSIVSGAPLEEIRRAVADADLDALRRIKGVGPKTAQRIVIDLQETFKALGPVSAPRRAAASDALLALTSLGFDRTRSEKAIRDSEAALKGAPAAEDLVREALKRL